MKRETYKAAQCRLLADLRGSGWKTATARTPGFARANLNGCMFHSIWFRPQAVYMASSPSSSMPNPCRSRSMHIDIRDMTFKTFMVHVALRRLQAIGAT